MSRFDTLYAHFEKNVGPMLPLLPQGRRRNLVYVYRSGVYRVYEGSDAKKPELVEVNPASSLTSLHEVWFFDGDQGLEAHVEYQPDYRPSIFIPNLQLPLLQLQVKDLPQVPGLH